MAEDSKQTLIDVIKSWPLKRKLSLAAVAVITLALFAVIILQAQVADYRLLYANLSDSDAASVINWLKGQKIPYRLAGEGKEIQVPGDKVYEARIELAGAGLPQGGGVGFEIFDKQNFGMTDFAQKVNFQRALQGELSRSIASLAPVEAARVQLALPGKSLFKDQQQPTTASVILKMATGRRLSDNQIQGIVYLVSSSVEGLSPGNVTLVDSNGRILSKHPQDNFGGAMTPGMLNYEQTIEQRLQNRAQALLDRALGPGNSLVQVTANIDFSKIEKTEELYDPNSQVARSEKVTKEKSGTAVQGGVPGVQANLKGASGGASAKPTIIPSSRSTDTTNYEISKTISKIVSPVGTIKSLSVAVLVADTSKSGPDGKTPVYVPRKASELQSIQNMVSSALGIEATRGDQIKVVSMPFQNEFAKMPLTPAPTSGLYRYLPYVKYGLLTLGLLLLYFLLVRPLLKTLQAEAPTQHYKTVEELENELTDEPRGQLPAPADPAQKLRQEMADAQSNPAQVIRKWLKEN
ncbi:MAG TPA: flagellar basal-body MS-ring/collar protein FliF [Desulfuromonadales bacterium]|nr:flagellar basal-body MS-ring/collar protein FliF [Desulfuromonadales bacterium]